jgi:hypothetical protein
MDYLSLSRSTVLSILTALEDRSLVVKSNDAADKRMMSISISLCGTEAVKQAIADLEYLMHNTIHMSLSSEEYAYFIDNTVAQGLAALRGQQINLDGLADSPSSVISAAYLIYWRLMIGLWTNALKGKERMTLNDYRLLCIYVNWAMVTRKSTTQGCLVTTDRGTKWPLMQVPPATGRTACH